MENIFQEFNKLSVHDPLINSVIIKLCKVDLISNSINDIVIIQAARVRKPLSKCRRGQYTLET